jgi:hypothetical protein
MCIKINKIGKQEVGIWWVQKSFPRYGVPIWSLWPNIRFLPSIVAEKNVTKNVHICSMCIKTNKVGKQEVGIWRVQKRYPQYGILIWRLWPNIRFLPSTVTEENATKNILDERTDGKQYIPLPLRKIYENERINTMVLGYPPVGSSCLSSHQRWITKQLLSWHDGFWYMTVWQNSNYFQSDLKFVFPSKCRP